MKCFAIFKSDGDLLCYAHEGYQNLSLPNYQNYSGLIVKEISEIWSGLYDVKLINGEIVKTLKTRYQK